MRAVRRHVGAALWSLAAALHACASSNGRSSLSRVVAGLLDAAASALLVAGIVAVVVGLASLAYRFTQRQHGPPTLF